jgi:serine/threonine protein kinase
MAAQPSTIGPYHIVRLLGEGGMGAVYEAVHETIERRVAIKVLHPEFASNAEFTARFFNEARAVNRVEHPGLVQISDYGQQPDGTAYIVMEFLRGESLSRRLTLRGGKLSTPEVLNLSRQIAEALAAAHTKNIVHRALDPRADSVAGS